MTKPLSEADLAALANYDTPTVCNALERVAPERRGYGYTRAHLHCARPAQPPIVGYARTALYRTMRPSALDAEAQSEQDFAYFDYVSAGPRPGVVVFQDVDAPGHGSAAVFGEVMSYMHKAMGCIGLVTDGAVRDMEAFVEGFQALSGGVAPSHGYYHIPAFGCEVNVAGMMVQSGDLIHADLHGAVIIPPEHAQAVVEASAALLQREKVIIDACKKPDFTVADLKTAWRGLHAKS